MEKAIFTCRPETGTFSSKASVEGNTLKLSIKKVYRQTEIKKEDFGKMLEFIDAAYDFSQEGYC